MSTTFLSGCIFVIIGAAIALINALFTLLHGANTTELQIKYIGGYVAASFNVLLGIAFFMAEIASKIAY